MATSVTWKSRWGSDIFGEKASLQKKVLAKQNSNDSINEDWFRDRLNIEEDISITHDFRNSVFEDAEKEIETYRYLDAGWDTYSAKPIIENAVDLAVEILELAKCIFDNNSFLLDKIIPTPLQDGGVAQEFINSNKCTTIIMYGDESDNKLIILREIDDEITEDYEIDFSKTSMEKEFAWLGR